MDCISGMKLIEDNSIDLVVTSPPPDLYTRHGRKFYKPLFQCKKEMTGESHSEIKHAVYFAFKAMRALDGINTKEMR